MKYTEEELIEELNSKEFKKSLKNIEELSQAFTDLEPHNKQILESRLLRLNLNLAKETLSKLKKDLWYNLLFIFVGFLLGYLPTLLSEDKTTKAIESLNKSVIERNEIEIQNQTDAQQMRLELISLKKELDSLKMQ